MNQLNELELGYCRQLAEDRRDELRESKITEDDEDFALEYSLLHEIITKLKDYK